jgi:hypothetical protein
MRRLLVLAAALGLLLGPSACSMVSLGYRNAPMLAQWWLDARFDFPDPQRQAIRAALDDTWRWHAGPPREALVELMREASGRLARPVTEADVEWAFDAMEIHAQGVGQRFATDLVARWPAMDAPALAALEAHLAERRAEQADERAQETEAQRLARRTAQIVDELENWFGQVSERQAAFIARSEAVRLDEAVWQRERARRHQRLLDILRQHPPAGLVPWLADWRGSRPAPVAAEADRQRAVYRRFWVDLLAMAEPAQREHARRRLDDWADALAAITPPTAVAARQDASCATC